jgi:hypothetical protein
MSALTAVADSLPGGSNLAVILDAPRALLRDEKAVGKYGYEDVWCGCRLPRLDAIRADPGRFIVSPVTLLGAVFDLNHPAHVVEWHFIQLSVANIVVIGLMILVFVLAIVLPFPGAARRRGGASS